MAKMKEGDDPKDFKVGEVQEYLSSASDEEKARVMQAESDGENRKTIVGGDADGGDEDLANPYTHDDAEQAAVDRAKAKKI